MLELARKYRPEHVADMWGNKVAKETLTSLISKEGRPQTYLFKGDAGCGKTSFARAYAKDLGIESVDIEELNASDHNGVDDARNLIEMAGYRFGDAHAIILDEAHYLTANAQSALLKLLEEPPKDTYIMLCTTNPEKLSKAILSRCIAITVAPMDEDDLTKCLKKVVRAEGIDTTIDVLEAIADKSEGVPRRALKLLDKVSGMDEDQALSVIKAEVSGEVDDPNIKALCQALLSGGPWKKIAENLKLIKGSDAESVRRQILGYMSAVLLSAPNPVAATVMGYFLDSFFSSGFSGLTYACFAAYSDIKQ